MWVWVETRRMQQSAGQSAMEANSEMDYKADCDLRDESGLNKVGIRQLAKRPDSDAIGRGDKVQRAGVGRVGMWRRSMTDG